MSLSKRFGAVAFSCLLVLGTVVIAGSSANAQQSELWRPNPLNSWMANRYHRKYAHRSTKHRRSTARHIARRHRRH